jgi:hypothetical protein
LRIFQIDVFKHTLQPPANLARGETGALQNQSALKVYVVSPQGCAAAILDCVLSDYLSAVQLNRKVKSTSILLDTISLGDIRSYRSARLDNHQHK